ncbi:MAG: 4-hydroxythreonine-4-phosphate dehydrogenase, partial [Sphaerospermopsis kisseleviana]
MTNTHQRPRLALTLGDPAGIGAEVTLKALADSEVSQNCYFVVVGSRNLLSKTYKNLTANTDNLLALANPDELNVIDVDVPNSGEI